MHSMCGASGGMLFACVRYLRMAVVATLGCLDSLHSSCAGRAWRAVQVQVAARLHEQRAGIQSPTGSMRCAGCAAGDETQYVALCPDL
jgi:hypothetical protein